MRKDDLDFSEIPVETRNFYAMPSKQTVKRFKDATVDQDIEEIEAIYSKSKIIYGLLASCAFGTVVTYIQLRTPAGDVVRHSYEQSLSPFRRYTRRTLPFIFGFATLAIARAQVHDIGIPYISLLS